MNDEELKLNAARYLWLREQDWWKDGLAVVVQPKSRVQLGTDCPSRERLDQMVDAGMAGLPVVIKSPVQ